MFRKNCARAVSEVVISSPRLANYQIARVFDELSPALLQDVKLTIFTTPSSDQPKSEEAAFQTCIQKLRQYGAKILEITGLHQRIAIFDRHTVWHGSANLLGNLQKSDSMIRFQEVSVAKALHYELNQAGKPDKGTNGVSVKHDEDT